MSQTMHSKTILWVTTKQFAQRFMLVKVVLLLGYTFEELFIILSKMVHSGYLRLNIQVLYNQLVYNGIFMLLGIVYPKGLILDIICYVNLLRDLSIFGICIQLLKVLYLNIRPGYRGYQIWELLDIEPVHQTVT